MAVSETARLVASLELEDKFSRGIDSANRKMSGLDRKMSSTTRATKGLGVAGVAVGTALGSIGAQAISAGIRTISGAITGGIESLNELESVTVETNAVIASTGGVAGQTSDEIRKLSEKYEDLNATMDDKVIQDAANTLLTFTGVGEEAFEPAIEAALNMNQLLGGGPEGLQGIVTMVGKALNNPIAGLTALSKKGVVFTDQQKEQIKALQESGDLLGAQQVILAELATEYGGQFAAAGETAAGKQAAFNDKIEELQMLLAGPLMPAIDRVRDKLTEFMGSERVQAGVTRLGEAIAGLFTDENIDKGVALVERGMDAIAGADLSGVGAGLGGIVAKIGGLPWGAIADAAKLLGTGSKALLDAFLGLPPWVQTAVLTGWGLNKLTGGALGGIVGELAKGLVKGVLGINAGVVNVNAATVNGPGGGVPAGGGGGLAGRIGGGLAIAGGVALAGTAAAMLVDHTIKGNEQRGRMEEQLNELPRATSTEIDDSIERLEGTVDAANDSVVDTLISNASGLNSRLNAEITELKQTKLNTARAAGAARDAIPWAQRNRAELGNLNTQERTHFASNSGKLSSIVAKASETTSAIHGQTPILGAIRDKNWSLTANITVPVSVGISGSTLQRTIQRQSVLAGNSSDNMVVPI